MRMNRVALLAATLAAGLSVGGVAHADMLVVRSLGNAARAFPPGRSLPDSASLTLAAGDSVTLLGARGTRTFRGPGTFRLASAAPAGGMAAAIGQPRARSRVGAVRGAPVARASFPADVAKGGNVCVADGWDLALWRADASRSVPLTIIASPGAPLTAEWPRGRALLDWPTEIPIHAGHEMRVGLGEESVPIRFVTLDAAPTDPQQAAALMIRHDCKAQLDRLVDALPQD